MHRKKAAPICYSDDEEDDIGPSAHLAGLKVGHDINKIDTEGSFLILRDQSILDETGNINEDEDELQNVLLVEQEKREHNKREKTRKRYDVSGEWDDADPSSSINNKKDILHHYDEVIDNKYFDKQKKTFRLDEKGKVKGKLDDNADKGELCHSLIDTVTFQTDFITPDIINFKKIKTKQKKYISSYDSLSFLNDEDVPIVDDDVPIVPSHHTYKNQGRRHNIPHSKDAAEVFAEKVLSTSVNKSGVNKLPHSKVQIAEEEDDDGRLYESLCKVRRLQQVSQTDKFSDREILNLIEKSGKEIHEDQEEDAADDMFALSSTTEFVKSVQTAHEKMNAAEREQYSGFQLLRQQMAERSKKLDLKMKGEAHTAKKKRPHTHTHTETLSEEERGVASQGGGLATLEGDGDGDGDGDRRAVDLVESSESEEEVEHQLGEQPLDMSLSSALNLLKSKGELDEEKWRISRWAKGNKTLTKSNDETLLEYKDEHGDLMNQKQAYKYLSWRFHGRVPGQNRQEMRLRKKEYERKLKGTGTSNNLPNIKSLQALDAAQSRGEAYIVLTGAAHTQKKD
eukprot:GHVR01025755.1.p1 GENE.GHVR01025755.1~~GHVR01025755.1.p1  ORF type:complete len:567 (+),score=170.51 GHVR01025755.1:57-1757(+)